MFIKDALRSTNTVRNGKYGYRLGKYKKSYTDISAEVSINTLGAGAG